MVREMRRLRCVWVLMLALGVVIAAAPQALAQRSQAEGFSRFELQTAGWRGGYSTVRFSDGVEAEQFVLRPGDCPRVTNDCNADRERIEFSERNPAQPVGSEVWAAWSIYLPADFAVPGSGRVANITLGQFHQRDSSGPELLFVLRRNWLEAELTNPYRLDDDPMNPIPPFEINNVLRTSQMLGRWNRIMVNARWSRGEDGFVRIYVNGNQAWAYNGPTTNSNAPIYFKYGIYRSFASRCGGPCPELTAYYSDVVRGNSREDVE